jgi:signal transduction histidine kinase
MDKIEENILNSTAILDSVLRIMPDIYIRFRNGIILDFIMPSQDALFPDADLIGKNLFDVLEDNLASRVLHFSEKAIETGQVQIFEHETVIDKYESHKEIRLAGVNSSSGESFECEFIMILRDISELKTTKFEVAKSLAEIEESQNTLEQKTKELSMLNDKLIESERVLREQNASKDKFFSIIAHDLRSPFTALLGLSEYLASDYMDLSKEDLKEIANGLMSSAQSTFNLLENLLQWARIKTGRIKLNPEAIELNKIIDKVLHLFMKNAQEKKILLEAEANHAVYVFADLNMIEVIIRNIVSNAIKFTNKEGKVIINTEVINEFVQISVRDNGVGMNNEAVLKLFKVGQNVSADGTQNEKGSGLGLILCKEFVELNGGEIFVESELGKGSTFKIKLPLFRENVYN